MGFCVRVVLTDGNTVFVAGFDFVAVPGEKTFVRGLENAAQVIKAAAGNAVFAALVFLYLLESDAKAFGDILLRHIPPAAQFLNIATDDLVDILGFARHLSYNHCVYINKKIAIY